jgi:hypothetical protein
MICKYCLSLCFKMNKATAEELPNLILKASK